MQHYFGREGILAQKVPGFEYRSSQMRMADAVLASLRGGLPLVVEAGTGTGKTWAYLIPALSSGLKVVISTGTKTLQDQILDHDIPFLRRSIFPNLRAVCLKGRKNYLCRRKFNVFSLQLTFWHKEEAKLLSRFTDWARSTTTGDRAEIAWLPDHFSAWNEVSSSSEQCLGQQCAEHSRCFLSLLRQEASRTDLVIVNHHLFFADLALRKNGHAEILPDYDAVIFDEAHQLETIIGLYFGLQLSNAKVNELIQDIQREWTGKSRQPGNLGEIHRLVEHLGVLNRSLYQHFADARQDRARYPLQFDDSGKNWGRICREMIHALQQLNACLGMTKNQQSVVDSFLRRSAELAGALHQILQRRDPTLVYWYELGARSVFIHGTPIEIGPICNEWLFGQGKNVVFTSATLAVAGSLAFFRESLGMPPETQELMLPSPFSFEEQALLYVPKRFPAPHSPQFCGMMAREAAEILKKTRGRGLLLFTSYKNLNAVHRDLQQLLPYPILLQGEKPKRQLLHEFRQKIDSILLATSSFWQGIDVPGEALSCLMIDKLPFEVPDDPLVAARMDHFSATGVNPFLNYQVPRAVIHLKQGVGRLIRSSRDQGVIVIFDIRLFTKSYGRIFLDSLPPCRLTRELSDIDHFLTIQ